MLDEALLCAAYRTAVCRYLRLGTVAKDKAILDYGMAKFSQRFLVILADF